MALPKSKRSNRGVRRGPVDRAWRSIGEPKEFPSNPRRHPEGQIVGLLKSIRRFGTNPSSVETTSTHPRAAGPLKVEDIAIQQLTPYQNNPRLHPKKQIDKLARAIKDFGFLIPALIDDQNIVLAGHARIEAAKQLALPSVPCIRASHLNETQKRAFTILDNRVAEEAKWDFQLLAKEVEFLHTEGIDLTTTGFEIPEIEMIFDAAAQPTSNPEDDRIPDPAPHRVATKRNDLWILDEHKLFCGDARRRESFAALLSGNAAQLIFVDPPYNVKIAGHVSGKGRIKHREFAQASGEKTSAQFTKFLEESLGLLAEHSADGAIHFVCSDWRHLDEMLTAGRRTYSELKNLVVWSKSNAGMGSFYRSQHELIFVWKHGRGKHVNNMELGQHGRNRTNVWTYAGSNAFGAKRAEELAMHPTVKPVGLVADAIRDCSRRGDLVLDSFGGSGTTLIACERTRRKARLIELDPAYCDQIVRRWQKLTGRAALHAVTGRPFNDNGAT
jgi:DNA modification methylase